MQFGRNIMIFKNFDNEGDWVHVEYAATWRYGYDFMLDAAQTLLADFGNDLQRFAKFEIAGAKSTEIVDEVKACGGKLRECKELSEECGAIAVAGISGVMECPIQIMFYNQTNVVRLDCPIKTLFEEHGEHVFDHYMSSVEIKAYCADTERRTLARMMK